MASSSPASPGSPSTAGASGATAVIIACAESDVRMVAEVARSLQERGHEVEVVTGANANGQALSATVAKFSRQGLYVLCRSPSLERAAIDQLRAVLRRDGVPFGRTLTLALESGPNAPRALEERILSVARRMVTGRGDTGPVNTPAILPPPTTKVTKAPEPPPGYQRDLAAEEIDTRVNAPSASAAAGPVVGPPPSRTSPPPSAPPKAGGNGLEGVTLGQADVDAWADSLAGKTLPPDFELNLDTSVDQALDVEAIGTGTPDPTFDAPSEGLRPQEVTQVGPDMPHLDEAAPIGDDFAPSGVDRTQVTAKPSSMFPPAPPPEPASSMPLPTSPPLTASPPAGLGGPAAVPSAEPSQGSMQVASFRPGPSRATLLMIGGALAAVAVLITVVIIFRGGGADDGPAKDDELAAAKTDPTPADAKASPEPAKVAPDAGDAAAKAEAPDEPEDADAEPEDADAEPAGDVRGTDEQPDEPKGKAEVEDASIVLAALQSRRVRALDTFLVTSDPGRVKSFDGAEAYCTGLEVEGLSSWRVPSIGELNSIAEAKIFRSGVLWSSTLGDAFGDERLVHNLKKGTMASVGAGWDGAEVVCIRERN